MALIKCTECGKVFSDKASGCPECGCPTEWVLKETNSAEVIAKTKESSQQATDSILAEVKKAKSKASSAESLFNSRNRSIQTKASSSIDLFGGYATSRVVEIQSDVREACDDLYTTYQTLVETLDGMCRPLLDFSPGGEAIKAVADAIRYFNEESEIESNFTASFNGSNLGNVANTKYVPSISNKMIQKFWESKYAESPYAIEYEKNRRKEAEEARIRREAERKKQEEQKRAEEQRKATEKAQAKAKMEKVVAEAEVLLSEYRQQLDSEGEKRIHTLQLHIEERLKSLSEQIASYSKQHNALGALRFAEKKKLAQEIQHFREQSSRLSDPQILSTERGKIQKIISVAAEGYSNEINEYLAKRFPYSKYGKRAIDRSNGVNEYTEDISYTDKRIPNIPNVQIVFDNNTR